MEIEQLIRDLIVEDQFNEKYTKRQRSIFCKNMYAKISAFVRRKDDELYHTRYQLDQYRQGYESLARQQRVSCFIVFLHNVFNLSIIVFFYYALYRWITETTPIDQSQIQSQTK